MQDLRRILLVDDEPTLSASLQTVLVRAGYVAEIQETIQGAFHALCEGEYDLLLLDLSLPDGDGMCLLAMCHRLLPQLPVLILTANDTVDTTLHANRLGVKGYLTKPVQPEQILYCVNEIMLEQHHMQRMSGRIRPGRIRREIYKEIDFTE